MLVSRQSMMPPEYFRGEHYGAELDCWQLGLIFYSLLTGMTLNAYARDFRRPIEVVRDVLA